MGNSLNEDLTNRHVVIERTRLAPEYRDIHSRIFFAEGGFGCLPFTSGTAVMGHSVIDGEKFRIGGYEVERFATDEEVDLARKAGDRSP